VIPRTTSLLSNVIKSRRELLMGLRVTEANITVNDAVLGGAADASASRSRSAAGSPAVEEACASFP